MFDPVGYADVQGFFMTSPGEGGFYPTAVSEGTPAWKPFGRPDWIWANTPSVWPNTGWASTSAGAGKYKSGWIKVQMPSAYDIRCVCLCQSAVISSTLKNTQYSIQYSDDSITFYDIPSHSYASFPQDWALHWFYFPSVGSHRYWRIYLWNNNATNSIVSLSILRFYVVEPEIGIIRMKGMFQNSMYAGGYNGTNYYNMPNGGGLVTSHNTYYNNGSYYNMQYIFDEVDNIIADTSKSYWLSEGFTPPGCMSFNFTAVPFDVLRYLDIYPNGRINAKCRFEVYYSSDNSNWVYAGTCSYDGIPGSYTRLYLDTYKPLGNYIQFQVYKIASAYMCINGVQFYIQKYTRRFLVKDLYDNKVYKIDGTSYLGVYPTIPENVFLNDGHSSLGYINYAFIKTLKIPKLFYYKR